MLCNSQGIVIISIIKALKEQRANLYLNAEREVHIGLAYG